MLRRRSERKTGKASAPRRPRFWPRFEMLESRVTPSSCTWDPVSKVLTGDAFGALAEFKYRSDGGGHDISCNFEFVATTPDLELTFNAGPGSVIGIDDLNAGSSQNYIDPLLISHLSCGPPFCHYDELVFNDNVEEVYFEFPEVDLFSGNWNMLSIGDDGVLNYFPVTTVYGHPDGNGDRISVKDHLWDEGGTYRVTDSQLILPDGIIVNHSNIDEIWMDTGPGDDTITLENTSGPWLDMPGVFTNTEIGYDTLVLDASTQSIGESYYIDKTGVKLPTDTGYIYVVKYTVDDDYSNVTLQCGSGQDIVKLAGPEFGYDLSGMPPLTIDGGGGGDSLIADDSTDGGGDTYQITSNQLILPDSEGLIATYSNFSTLTLKTGAGNDEVVIGEGQLNFIPETTVDGGGGVNHLIVDDSLYDDGDIYQITADHLEVATLGHIATYSNISTLTLKTGVGDDEVVIGEGHLTSFYPEITVDGGGGVNHLIVDDSLYDEGGIYQITADHLDVDSLGQFATYSNISTLTLKTGPGSDTVTIGDSALDFIPKTTVDGGGGVNSLIVDDSAYTDGDTYQITSNQVSLPDSLGLIATYSNISTLTLKTGAGDDRVWLGTTGGALAGLPGLSIFTNGGSDVLLAHDEGNPNDDAYQFVRFDQTQVNLSTPSLGLAKIYDIETVDLFAGNGNNVFNVDNGKGLLPQALTFHVQGAGGNDTLNYRDNKNNNPVTYVVKSYFPQVGSVDVPATGFIVSFSGGVNTVNLYTSLQPGTVVDTSGYDPAHYVLNVFNTGPISLDTKPTEQQPDADGGGQPLPPAPPRRDSQASTYVCEAPLADAPGVNRVDRSMEADLIFADPLSAAIPGLSLPLRNAGFQVEASKHT